jgi:urea transport system substrate-binding protein
MWRGTAIAPEHRDRPCDRSGRPRAVGQPVPVARGAVDAVRQAMYGQKVMSLSGYEVQMFTNHHLSKPVMIDEVRANGQFDTVWQTKGPIKAEAWSPHIAENKGKVADWSYPWVCGNCTEPKFR